MCSYMFVLRLGAAREDFFFFNDTATTEIYTLSLHDALPISGHERRDVLPGARRPVRRARGRDVGDVGPRETRLQAVHRAGDRKSTRLNSSHLVISYAVFCLKKKKTPIEKPLMRASTMQPRYA